MATIVVMTSPLGVIISVTDTGGPTSTSIVFLSGLASMAELMACSSSDVVALVNLEEAMVFC